MGPLWVAILALGRAFIIGSEAASENLFSLQPSEPISSEIMHHDIAILVGTVNGIMENRYFVRIPRKNIWKLMLDIKQATSAGAARPSFGKPVRVDFWFDNDYKESTIPITVVSSQAGYEELVRREFFRGFEQLEHKLELLKLKAKGARFVVEVPKIELD